MVPHSTCPLDIFIFLINILDLAGKYVCRVTRFCILQIWHNDTQFDLKHLTGPNVLRKMGIMWGYKWYCKMNKCYLLHLTHLWPWICYLWQVYNDKIALLLRILRLSDCFLIRSQQWLGLIWSCCGLSPAGARVCCLAELNTGSSP